MSRLPKQILTVNPRLKALSALDFVLFGKEKAKNNIMLLTYFLSLSISQSWIKTHQTLRKLTLNLHCLYNTSEIKANFQTTLGSMVLNDNSSLWTFKVAALSHSLDNVYIHNHFLTWEPLYTLYPYCQFVIFLLFATVSLKNKKRQCAACAYCISASVSNLNTVIILCLYRCVVYFMNQKTRSVKFQLFIVSLTSPEFNWTLIWQSTSHTTSISWGSMNKSAIVESSFEWSSSLCKLKTKDLWHQVADCKIKVIHIIL